MKRHGLIVSKKALSLSNDRMVVGCGGHAWWYERYARLDSALEDCQESAQAARLGLWAYHDPIAPWVWRKQ